MDSTLTKCSKPVSPSKGQINTMCLLVRHPETRKHFCGTLATNAEPELHEEAQLESDIRILLIN